MLAVASSEAGALDIEPERIIRKGKSAPANGRRRPDARLCLDER